jgi:hypothetical protein
VIEVTACACGPGCRSVEKARAFYAELLAFLDVTKGDDTSNNFLVTSAAEPRSGSSAARPITGPSAFVPNRVGMHRFACVPGHGTTVDAAADKLREMGAYIDADYWRRTSLQVTTILC